MPPVPSEAKLLEVVRDLFLAVKLPPAMAGGGFPFRPPPSPLPALHKRSSAAACGPPGGAEAAFARLPRTAPSDSLLSR